jgi:hypothetical protein
MSARAGRGVSASAEAALLTFPPAPSPLRDEREIRDGPPDLREAVSVVMVNTGWDPVRIYAPNRPTSRYSASYTSSEL